MGQIRVDVVADRRLSRQVLQFNGVVECEWAPIMTRDYQITLRLARLSEMISATGITYLMQLS